MILSNQAKCLKCNDEIYSASVHHYQSCSCGGIFVDGGQEYLRHGYMDKAMYENQSQELPEEVFETVMSALEWCDETGRNNLGKVCAIFRALRDTGYLESLNCRDVVKSTEM